MAKEPQQHPQSHHSHKGVICLFCGTRVALNAKVEKANSNSRISILWCQVCGREAPYRPAEIIELHDEPTAANFWDGGIRPI
jgi:transcription elongation factor Elf1